MEHPRSNSADTHHQPSQDRIPQQDAHVEPLQPANAEEMRQHQRTDAHEHIHETPVAHTRTETGHPHALEQPHPVTREHAVTSVRQVPTVSALPPSVRELLKDAHISVAKAGIASFGAAMAVYGGAIYYLAEGITKLSVGIINSILTRGKEGIVKALFGGKDAKHDDHGKGGHDAHGEHKKDDHGHGDHGHGHGGHDHAPKPAKKAEKKHDAHGHDDHGHGKKDDHGHGHH